MTTVTRRVVWGLAAAVVLVVVGGVAFVKLRPHAPPVPPPELVHVPASWAQYRATPGHQTHVAGGEAKCRDCHDFDRNGFKNPGTAVCTKCHAREAAGAHHGPGTGSGECLTCHTFALGDTDPTCIDCHRTPQGGLPAIVQHATVDCSTCHHLGQTPSLVLADCSGCHDNIHLKHQMMGNARWPGSHGCVDCHHGHEPASAAKAVCTSCHNENKQPHPPAHDACTNCHEPHEFAAANGLASVKQSTCIGCHGHKRTLAERAVPAHRVCANCHNLHVSNSSACAGCHWNMQLMSHGKEKACTTCHVLHGDDPHSVGGLDAGDDRILRDFGK